jgi:hypothetical protein
MEISSGLRETIVKEIRYAVENMKKSDKLNEKMYFFSAVYAIVDRAFNFEYDPQLIFIHQVVRQAFDTINSKIALMTQTGVSIGTVIPNNLFPKLQDTLNKLADSIEENKNSYSLLEIIANIGYSATGNGSYLCFKGLLKV